MRANLDARPDERVSSDPRALLDDDGLHDQVECRRFVIMIARAEKRPLRDANIVRDRDVFKVQQPAFLAQPDVIAQRELPWKGDFYLWLDGHAPADFCAE